MASRIEKRDFKNGPSKTVLVLSGDPVKADFFLTYGRAKLIYDNWPEVKQFVEQRQKPKEKNNGD